MYRGQPIVHLKDCEFCKGTGRAYPEADPYTCGECNGTGKAGDPAALVLILLLWFVLLAIGGLVWLFNK
jgi:hypothetical protein